MDEPRITKAQAARLTELIGFGRIVASVRLHPFSGVLTAFSAQAHRTDHVEFMLDPDGSISYDRTSGARR